MLLAAVSLIERLTDLIETVSDAARVEASDTSSSGTNSTADPDTRIAETISELLSADEPRPADSPDSSVRAALGPLAHPAVAEALLLEVSGTGRASGAALGLFAESAEPLLPPSTRPALRWLRAKAYEELEDVAAAEAALRDAESLDPAWPLTVVDLARYYSDRGDATRALSLLRRIDTPRDDALVELLTRFQATARTDIGRNQPCWCGSGRKYKQCHLRREEVPLSERAAWLYQKAGMYLQDGKWQLALLEVAQERARYSDAQLGLLTGLDEPLVADAVLFEGGAFADFLTVRGALLPDDERLLAEQWLLIQRSVHEVEATRPGQGLTLRDLRTGDTREVRERTASRQLRTGTLICARVVPAADTTQIFGGVEPVLLAERDELITLLDSEPDATELVAFLTRRLAPPALQP